MRQHLKALRRLACGLAVVGLTSFTAVAVTPATSGANTKTVISFEGTNGVAANYIFPFMTVSKFSVQNIDYFEYYLYRPLYMYGGHASTELNTRLSLAKYPVFSKGDKSVRITLKAYRWSDTEKVTASDVLFWMNIWHQKPTGYAGWFPGGLSLPTDVKTVKITSPTTLTMTLATPVNQRWFLYNELSEITPMPIAWTRASLTAAPGSAGCAKAPFTTTGKGGTNYAKCKAVYVFLSEQSGYNPTNPKTVPNALPGYATNKLWAVVDGPWKLESFTPTGPYTMVPNPKYSGPNKPKYKEYVDKVYTTSSAAYNAMVSGTLDIGQLPPTEITAPAKKSGKPGVAPEVGPNNARLAADYTLVPEFPWEVNFFPYNFKSTGDTGQAAAIFSELYFRQAMQRLVNQTLYIKTITHGYGVPDYGPVPDLPKNGFMSRTELKNPYPYSPSAARSLLKSHGWKVVPGGVDTCRKPGTGPGKCGKGVKKGAKLNFTLQYNSQTKSIGHTIVAEKDSWGQAGIRVNISGATFNTVIGNASPCPKGCKWEFEDWGAGWIFVPDIYPAGTEILAAGAGSNFGSWSTKTSTALVEKTITGTTTLIKYENYEEKYLPYIFQPLRVPVWEVHKGLKGVAPLNPLYSATPATYHWS